MVFARMVVALQKCNFLVMEISYGSFETLLELPKGYDLSWAKAMYANGFLRIDVPPAGRSTGKGYQDTHQSIV